MAKGSFDAERFYGVLDSHRISRNLTWKQVAEESDVNASTLTRMAQGKRPDVDSLAALLKWSNETSASFVASEPSTSPPKVDTLAAVMAQFRADSNLTEAGKKALETTVKVLYEQFRDTSSQ